MGDEAEMLLKRRFAIVNVWRPIRGPLRDAPLALCDAQSVVSVVSIRRIEMRTSHSFYAACRQLFARLRPQSNPSASRLAAGEAGFFT
jgi:hypothetical protein